MKKLSQQTKKNLVALTNGVIAIVLVIFIAILFSKNETEIETGSLPEENLQEEIPIAGFSKSNFHFFAQVGFIVKGEKFPLTVGKVYLEKGEKVALDNGEIGIAKNDAIVLHYNGVYYCCPERETRIINLEKKPFQTYRIEKFAPTEKEAKILPSYQVDTLNQRFPLNIFDGSEVIQNYEHWKDLRNLVPDSVKVWGPSYLVNGKIPLNKEFFLWRTHKMIKNHLNYWDWKDNEYFVIVP